MCENDDIEILSSVLKRVWADSVEIIVECI